MCRLADCLHDSNHQDEAVATVAEATQLHQRLDFNSDVVGGSDLTMSRIYLDNYLSCLL